MPTKTKPKTSLKPPAQPTHIRDLKPDPANARKHNPRNIGVIADAMQDIGAARSVVIDEENYVLAGNGALEAAAQAGITKLQIIDADGETVIAVRRTGLTPEQKVRLAIADNRSAELAEWDVDVLKQLQTDGVDLSALWYPNELALLFPDEPTDKSDHWQGMPECENDDLEAWKSIKVNFNSAESLRAFAALIQQPLTENTRSVWYPEAEIGRTADKRYTDV